MDEGINQKKRIDSALFERGLVESRREGQECIEKGHVTLNGIVVLKTHQLVGDEDALFVEKRRKYVSRGGDKLEGVLHEVYGSDQNVRDHLRDMRALDIGSSTGGFTDCLLSYGVKAVDAVDVGTSQLHQKLKEDERVRSFENTDIRDFLPMNTYDIIVADLSFISITYVLPTIISFVAPGTEVFLLIKPQFEAGKGNLKKGIMREENVRLQIVEDITEEVKNTNAKEVLTYPCVISGGDGNQEYFMYAAY